MVDLKKITNYDETDHLRFKTKDGCSIFPEVDEPGNDEGLVIHIFKVGGTAWVIVTIDGLNEPFVIKAADVLIEQVEFKPII